MNSRASFYASVAVVLLTFASVPTGLSAQRRVTVSPGIAAGTAVSGSQTNGSVSTSVHHALVSMDVEAARLPVRLRGEVMAVAASQSHGPISLGASAIIPLGRGHLRPYAVAGGGVYGVGGVGHPLGWSAGAGAEYRGRSTTLFAELRRHTQTPSAVSVGVRF